ncbi:phosphoribulokinase [Kordia sp. SMS9]|uniref:uridine kinase family protein n=1 Tax=Kordia sp. SMS9 TaxID=2282170 RepID=UPI000E0D91F0|nr:hypothetical protein [Kordia sp. SMS9]AXG68545.1 phosphoribulokinase [Kordia sp. SMS9]
MIQDTLSAKIIANKKVGGLTIVAICGAADLGKSYLSKKIIESLATQNLKANHLTLDSYLIDRKTRNAKGISGYHIQAYDLNEALHNLTALKNGQSIDFKPYLHKEGKKGHDSIKLNPAEILIFDGLHSMHSSFLPHIDISIFLYTKEDTLKQIRTAADLVKRNYTIAFSKKISESEFSSYKINIEPYKNKADHLLFLESKWNYDLINNY